MRILFSELIEYNEPQANQCIAILKKKQEEYYGTSEEYVAWLEKTLPCKVIRNSKEEVEIEFPDEVYTMLVLRYC
jgi:hypothetical protein